MRRIRGVSTRGSLRAFLAAGRRRQPARHRRFYMTRPDVVAHLLDEPRVRLMKDMDQSPRGRV